MGLPEPWCQLECTLAVKRGLVEPVDTAKLHQHMAQVGMDPSIIRLALQHLEIRRRRFIPEPQIPGVPHPD